MDLSSKHLLGACAAPREERAGECCAAETRWSYCLHLHFPAWESGPKKRRVFGGEGMEGGGGAVGDNVEEMNALRGWVAHIE